MKVAHSTLGETEINDASQRSQSENFANKKHSKRERRFVVDYFPPNLLEVTERDLGAQAQRGLVAGLERLTVQDGRHSDYPRPTPNAGH